MASWLAAQYNGVLVLGTSMVFVPFLASFGLQVDLFGIIWAVGPPLLGLLAHMGGPGPKVAKSKGPKSENLNFFRIPFWTHFLPKAVKLVLRGYLGTGLAKMLSTGVYLNFSSA